MNERIVCLDIGDVRIGVAVSDPSGTIASPVEVIRRIGWGPDVQKIKAICDRYGTNRILSGLPLNMDGTEGFQAQKVRDFCRQLEANSMWIRSPLPSFYSSGLITNNRRDKPWRMN